MNEETNAYMDLTRVYRYFEFNHHEKIAIMDKSSFEEHKGHRVYPLSLYIGGNGISLEMLMYFLREFPIEKEQK